MDRGSSVAAVASMTDRQGLQGILDDVARQLVRTTVTGKDGTIVMPMVYLGGSPIVIHVRPDGDEFVVSDQGRASYQADVLGAGDIFPRVAKHAAAAAGVEFDGQAVFAIRVPVDWLTNAVIFVATASRQALEMAAERLTVDVEETLRERLKVALKETFRGRAAFDVTVPGASSKGRHFTALVQVGERRTLFDVVMPSPVSVSFSIVKFQDVAQLETPPGRVAMLGGGVDAPDQSLLARWARVQPFTDNRQVLQEAA